jgi:hypothetical protein
MARIQARDPAAVIGPPDGPERLDAAEKCLGRPLPADYRAFLEHVGRIAWPCVVGNLIDFRDPGIEPRFAPFSPEIEGSREGFVRDRPPARKLEELAHQVEDARGSIRHLSGLAARTSGEQQGDLEAHVRQLEEEIDDANALVAVVRKPHRLPKDLAIDRYWTDSNTLGSMDAKDGWAWTDLVPLRANDDDGPQRVAFTKWLERRVDDALEEEAREKNRPMREAAEYAAEQAEAAVELPERARRRARCLVIAVKIVAWLRAEGKMEVVAGFDADHAAQSIVPGVSEGWAAGILDKLAERDDVVEVYATTEELEEALPTL